MNDLKTLQIPIAGGNWPQFAAKLKDRRIELGLSLAQVAASAGCVENTIRNFESKHAKSMNICSLIGLANALKIRFVLEPVEMQ